MLPIIPMHCCSMNHLRICSYYVCSFPTFDSPLLYLDLRFYRTEPTHHIVPQYTLFEVQIRKYNQRQLVLKLNGAA